MLDSGYDLARPAFLLADLPVTLIGRLRSDRVLARPVGPRPDRARGRPPRHGPLVALADPDTWPAPDQTTTAETTRYVPRGPARGIGAIPGWSAAGPGATTTASSRSSRAP